LDVLLGFLAGGKVRGLFRLRVGFLGLAMFPLRFLTGDPSLFPNPPLLDLKPWL
jgi:hypothetical protein